MLKILCQTGEKIWDSIIMGKDDSFNASYNSNWCGNLNCFHLKLKSKKRLKVIVMDIEFILKPTDDCTLYTLETNEPFVNFKLDKKMKILNVYVNPIIYIQGKVNKAFVKKFN